MVSLAWKRPRWVKPDHLRRYIKKVDHIEPGWWFEPLWKKISQLGWLFPIYGKIKFMFQTTNQEQYIENIFENICFKATIRNSTDHSVSISPTWRYRTLELRKPQVMEGQTRSADTAVKYGSIKKMYQQLQQSITPIGDREWETGAYPIYLRRKSWKHMEVS